MPEIKKMQIQVNEAYVKNYLLNGTYNFKPLLNLAIKKEDKKYTLLMKMEINNTIDNPFPIDMKVVISGTFEFGNATEDEIDKFMKKEAVQMLYPYLRSYVTSFSTSSMLAPIVLPIIDVRNIEIKETIQ